MFARPVSRADNTSLCNSLNELSPPSSITRRVVDTREVDHECLNKTDLEACTPEILQLFHGAHRRAFALCSMQRGEPDCRVLNITALQALVNLFSHYDFSSMHLGVKCLQFDRPLWGSISVRLRGGSPQSSRRPFSEGRE
jgi:hypothetical protein